MPDRTVEAAVRSHLLQCQRAVATIADAKFVADRLPGLRPVYVFDLNGGRPQFVRAARRRLQPRITEEVAFESTISGFEGVGARYRYELREFDGREILAYHLHPGASRSLPNFPHLHVSGGAGDLIPELQRAHLPAGAVSLADFVALLIRDFGVRPLRPDWEEILASPAKKG